MVNEPQPLEKVQSAPGPYSSQKTPVKERRPALTGPPQPIVIEPTPEKPKQKKERSQSRARAESAAKKKEAARERKKSVYLQKINKTGLSVDLEELLDEFNWNAEKSLDQLYAEVKAELGRVESSNVVVNLDRDDRVDQLASILDEGIKECELMDGLLTLYSVELSVSMPESLEWALLICCSLGMMISSTLRGPRMVSRFRLPTRSSFRRNCQPF